MPTLRRNASRKKLSNVNHRSCGQAEEGKVRPRGTRDRNGDNQDDHKLEGYASTRGQDQQEDPSDPARCQDAIHEHGELACGFQQGRQVQQAAEEFVEGGMTKEVMVERQEGLAPAPEAAYLRTLIEDLRA